MSTPDQSERDPRPYEPAGYEPPAYRPPPEQLGFDEPEREYRPIHPEPAWRSVLRKLWAPLAFVGLLFWKFKFVLAAIFKLKLLP